MRAILAWFYDHFFEWGLKEEILKLIMIRTRNRIKPNSAVRILASDLDLYVAVIDGKIIVKIGPGFDVGNLVPQSFKKIATSGKDYCCMGEKNNPDMKNPAPPPGVARVVPLDMILGLMLDRDWPMKAPSVTFFASSKPQSERMKGTSPVSCHGLTVVEKSDIRGLNMMFLRSQEEKG
ncbi:Alpha-amylase type B isozyme [Vitis vinifera]|uniref:alpha-amylase n=1 Tax=Vitis vinifera TaxID=29760 RepID=A0A438FMR2_VITVI|nr:Alpha-amylase type B isozyme [Vitis vinifera]